MKRSSEIAIVGGGIAGIAHAYHALLNGYKVVLFEREEFPAGASIRNFGLIWPIGQMQGVDFERALRSREHWKRLAEKVGFHMDHSGSLHLAYRAEEWDVLNEFAKSLDNTIAARLVSPDLVIGLSPIVKTKGLKGALYSKSESTVYSREAVPALLKFLEETMGLIVVRRQTVVEVKASTVRTSCEQWDVQRVVVCSGADFETLYPSLFENGNAIKCKLQMMRIRPVTNVRIGPALCAGLTLRHYKSFSQCPSLPLVDKYYDELDIRYKAHGIHVLVSQTPGGDLIIGDSHHYAKSFEPFDSEEINQLILDYLSTFADVGEYQIIERWNGVYPKIKDQNMMITQPEPGVTVVNGLGGAGMTLSFGIAEEVINSF